MKYIIGMLPLQNVGIHMAWNRATQKNARDMGVLGNDWGFERLNARTNQLGWYPKLIDQPKHSRSLLSMSARFRAKSSLPQRQWCIGAKQEDIDYDRLEPILLIAIDC